MEGLEREWDELRAERRYLNRLRYLGYLLYLSAAAGCVLMLIRHFLIGFALLLIAAILLMILGERMQPLVATYKSRLATAQEAHKREG